jgi:Ca2+-transporting ATPase
LTLAVGQLFHVFNMPEKESKIFDNEVTRNRWVWAAMALCAALILGGVYIPGIRDVLGVRPPGLIDWGLIIGFAFIPLLIGRIITLVRSHFARPQGRRGPIGSGSHSSSHCS